MAASGKLDFFSPQRFGYMKIKLRKLLKNDKTTASQSRTIGHKRARKNKATNVDQLKQQLKSDD